MSALAAPPPVGRDLSSQRGLTARDLDAFVEAWRRGTRRTPLARYLGSVEVTPVGDVVADLTSSPTDALVLPDPSALRAPARSS